MTSDEFHLAVILAADFAEYYFNALEANPKESAWSSRVSVARFYGYMDAKFMCFLMGTIGFPLVECVLATQKIDPLRVPYLMLEYELSIMGKKPSSIASTLEEIRRYDTTLPSLLLGGAE